MRKTREQIEYQLSIKRNRLELYLKREAEMLDGGVQSYAAKIKHAQKDFLTSQGIHAIID